MASTTGITARTLAAGVGQQPLRALDIVADEIAAAVHDLTCAVRAAPMVDVGDPLVVQLRALALLARRHPCAGAHVGPRLYDLIS